MRASPSLVHSTGTNYYGAINNNNGATFNNFVIYQASPRVALIYNGNLSGLTAGQAYRLYLNNDLSYIHLEAEI